MDFFRGTGARKAVVGCQEWALLVIAASDGLLPVQLQKSLHLLGQRFPELAKTGFYEFRTVGSGQFSEQVYADAESLAREGLVSIRYSDRDVSRHYRSTPVGAQKARKLEKQLRPEILQSLRKLVSWVSTRSVDELLRHSVAPTDAALRPPSSDRGTLRPR